MKYGLLPFLLLAGAVGTAQAAGVDCGVYQEKGSDGVMVDKHYPCEKAPVNLYDKASLQRGASIYMSYCAGCHSMKYLRYERMADDLSIPKELVEKYMMFTTDKVGSTIDPKINPKMQAQWFGSTPPDLTLAARLRSPDWLYTYLLSFYPDDKRPWGVNNKVFKDVAMPHVLYALQQDTGDEYQKSVGDLVNFMTYAAEPVQKDRREIGVWVTLFLLLLLIPVYWLNREYWKDVK